MSGFQDGRRAAGAMSAEEYAWERDFERTWENIIEDEKGLIQSDSISAARRATIRHEANLANIQRGMLRYLYVIVDLTPSMAETDIHSNRLDATYKVLKIFIKEFFDQNPISNLGFIAAKAGVAKKISDLGGNPSTHAARLVNALKEPLIGSFSLKAALEYVIRSFSILPPYATREVLVIHGAVSSCDSGDIFETIDILKEQDIRVNIVSFPGEVFIASKICQETDGMYMVPMNAAELQYQLSLLLPPPPKRPNQVKGTEGSAMIQVGFPTLTHQDYFICECHKAIQQTSYICPRCSTRVCEIPSTCPVCDLMLQSAPALARSYHHLFPVSPFLKLRGLKIEMDSLPLDEAIRVLGPYSAALEVGNNDANGKAVTHMVQLVSLQIDTEDLFAQSPKQESMKRESALGGESTGQTELVAMEVEGEGQASGKQGVESESHYEGFIISKENLEAVNRTTACFACEIAFPTDSSRFICPSCSIVCCEDCDILIHESLHNCPGCL